MPSNLQLNAVAFISPQNRPIVIQTFVKHEHSIKYHYIAHTSLDIVEERINSTEKWTECYLGLLYTMEDVAVYGYITPLKVKIILALALADFVVKDLEMITIFKSFHMAYYSSVSNPFLKLEAPTDSVHGHSPYQLVGNSKWRSFRKRIDEVHRAVGNVNANINP